MNRLSSQPDAHSLPAIHSGGRGDASMTYASTSPAATVAGNNHPKSLSKKTKYSITEKNRDPAAAQRAKRYVDRLSQTAPGGLDTGDAASTHPQHAERLAAPPLSRGFHLSPAESYVVAQKEATAEKWRSELLKHEADLRELVITNTSSMGEEPPTTSRMVRVLKIFDAVCRACENMSPNLAEMLRLFRIEFCRGIFSNLMNFDIDDDDGNEACGEPGTTGGPSTSSGKSTVPDLWTARTRSCLPYKVLADPDLMERIAADDVTTYFDQVGSLVRENALLSSEVAVGNSRARLVELTREIDSLTERIKLYESEVGRLARQNDQVLEQCNRAREELAEAKVKHEQKIASNEQEMQALNVENKDLQLQLFRLRKQVAGGKTKQLKDAYRQMKTEKMKLLTTLFSEGDERMAVLVMLSQLESRVNEILDRYDNDFMLTPHIALADLRSKMGESVTVLLEEMHMCEQNYRRLVPQQARDPTSEETDETDGYVAILFDQKIYENLLTREAIKQRLQQGAELLAQHGTTYANSSVTSTAAGAHTTSSHRATESHGRLTSLQSLHPSTLAGGGRDSSNGGPQTVGQSSLFPLVEADNFAQSHDSGLLVAPHSQSPSGGGGENGDTAQKKISDPQVQKLNDLFLKSSFTQVPTVSQVAETNALIPSVASSSLRQQQQRSLALRGVSVDGIRDAEPLNLEDVVFLKRSEWIDRIFTVSPQEELLQNVLVYLTRQHTRGPQQFSPDVLMPRLLRHPLHDLSSKKFLSMIDVFCGQDPMQQRRLCTISYVDPSIPIQLPDRSNFMKIKYRSPYAPAPTRGHFAALQDGAVARMTHDSDGNNKSNTSGTDPRRRSRVGAGNTGNQGQESTHAVAMGKSGVGASGVFMTSTGDLARLEDSTGTGLLPPSGNGASSQAAGASGQRKSFARGGSVVGTEARDSPTRKSSAIVSGGVRKHLNDWGGKTAFAEEPAAPPSFPGRTDGVSSIATAQVTVVGRDRRVTGTGYGPGNGAGTTSNVAAGDSEEIFNVNENLRVFRELTNPSLMKSGKADQQKAGATSSTTATTVAFQRLNPLSPNRGPEWTIYKSLFGSFRSLTPRMIEVTAIDHILMSACERHFTRMEYRYQECLKEAKVRSTNSQMSLAMAERFFREAYELTDFQEALIDELEARYSFPELVAKTLYEILCYLDAMAHKDELLALYLNVIRGFQPPSHLHYISYMLFHLSYCWPTSNPTEEVSRDDALTVLRYLYRNSENIVHVDIHEVLRDYQMTTRSAPLTFVSMRKFMAAAMMHQEECLLLYLNGLFSSHCECESLEQLSYENYEEVVNKHWQDRAEQKSVVRFLGTGLGLDRGPLLAVKDLAAIAASEWCSNLWR